MSGNVCKHNHLEKNCPGSTKHHKQSQLKTGEHCFQFTTIKLTVLCDYLSIYLFILQLLD